MKNYRPHLLVACALAFVLLAGLQDVLRNAVTDFRFRWTGREATGQIAVIAIDPRSIEKIGVWPWPRQLHADLLRALEQVGVDSIAFDVDFSSPSDKTSDEAFRAALESAGGSVILPAFKQMAGAGDARTIHVNRPAPPFAAHAWEALVNVPVDPDGRVRHYALGAGFNGEMLPSMGVLVAGGAASEQEILLDFGIRAASIPLVSYADVLRGVPAALERIKGKRVIIGGTAIELGDRFSVPNQGIIAGPVLQALAAESIAQNRALRMTSPAATGVALIVVFATALAFGRRGSAAVRVAVLAVTSLSIEIFGLWLQSKYPFVLDTALVHVAVVAYLAAVGLDEIDLRTLFGRIAERRFQRIAMSFGDGLVCADHQGYVTIWNRGAEAIFGYAPEEMIGKPLNVILAGARGGQSFSLERLSPDMLQAPSGYVVELDGHHRDGTVFPVEACFSGWQGADHFQYGAIIRDITERKREEERIRYLAEYDTITGLANRRMLEARLNDMIALKSTAALLVVSIDSLQQINDRFGHACGDNVLCAAAERLKGIGHNAFLARVGGDGFAIVASDATDTAIVNLAQRIVKTFDAPLDAVTRQHRVTVSIGAAVYPGDAQSGNQLLANSHLAQTRAKTTKHLSHVRFNRSFRDELDARLTLELDLVRALSQDEFELFFQPQVRLTNQRLIGAEALIRWRHPTRGLVSPGEFIPVVNASPISDSVARWVLDTACRQARLWELRGHPLRVAVNLSPSQLHGDDLVSSVATALALTRLTPSLLELEVTEDILLGDADRALEIFRELQGMGVRLVFDDFGTGYASLSYLKKFPLDGLKIDRSFVIDLRPESGDAAIVLSTIELGKKLGLAVIAEGIETQASAELLAEMGCDEGQGYFYGRPLPAAAFEAKFLVDDATPVSLAG